jgi:hypothetical protein
MGLPSFTINWTVCLQAVATVWLKIIRTHTPKATKYTWIDFCKYVNPPGVLLHLGTLQLHWSNNPEKVSSLSLSYEHQDWQLMFCDCVGYFVHDFSFDKLSNGIPPLNDFDTHQSRLRSEYTQCPLKKRLYLCIASTTPLTLCVLQRAHFPTWVRWYYGSCPFRIRNLSHTGGL